MTSEVFKKEYSRLNHAQKEAVDTIEGPVMVVAGPGTGKTQILTLRIAHILMETDAGAHAVLALTFTEAGVQAMKERLFSIIGETAYDVHIYTYHSFCSWLHAEYPENFEYFLGATLAEEEDQFHIVKDILSNNYTFIKPYGDPYFYLKSIVSSVSSLKREGITPLQFKENIESEIHEIQNDPENTHQKGKYEGKMKGEPFRRLQKCHRSLELFDVYSRYEERLKKDHLYDYDDMILSVVVALREDVELRRNIMERFLYILADEHQDANSAQNEILELITEDPDSQPNLFVVGDEKQAIYRFQGASGGNFSRFSKRLPSVKTIVLDQNYRSTQTILEHAYKLGSVLALSNAVNKKLTSHNTLVTNKEIVVQEAKSVFEQADAIATTIQDLHTTEKIPFEEMAVVYRRNNDSKEIQTILNHKGIPYTINSNQNLFDTQIIKDLMLFFAVACDPYDNRSLSQILLLPFMDIPTHVVISLTQKLRRSKKSLYELMADQSLFKTKKDFKRVLNVYDMVGEWHTSYVKNEKEEILTHFIEKTHFLQFILTDTQVKDSLTALRLFMQRYRTLCERWQTLDEVYKQLELMQEEGLLLRVGDVSLKSGVKLMTAHRSKGLEYRVVFILGASDEVWNRKKSPTYFWLPDSIQQDAPVDDERKLFYVALTRAKQELFIFVPKEREDGKTLSPLRFIEELGENIEYKKAALLEPEKELSLLFATSANHIHKEAHDFFETLSQEALLKDGLSVSGLNNYLECSWKWFFDQVVRLPQPKHPKAAFGSFMHKALQYIFDHRKNTNKITLKNIDDALSYAALKQTEISPADLNVIIKDAKDLLESYLETFAKDVALEIETEVYIQAWRLFENKRIRIHGFIDRIEKIGDATYKVVDYKTTKPKTEGEVRGTTKNSNGNYYRQLCFYALLMRESRRGEMVEGTISFLLPDSKNQYKEVSVSLDSDDCVRIEEEIKQMLKDIFTPHFLEYGACNKADCHYCQFIKNLDFKA